MANLPKGYKDAKYYIKGRKRPIAESTAATMHFLALVHEKYPKLVINDLKKLLLNKQLFITNYEAIAVLDAHIKAGYGDYVPTWKY